MSKDKQPSEYYIVQLIKPILGYVNWFVISKDCDRLSWGVSRNDALHHYHNRSQYMGQITTSQSSIVDVLNDFAKNKDCIKVINPKFLINLKKKFQ